MACLWIIRHADAEKDNYDKDFDRELTELGKKEITKAREKFLEKIDAEGLVLVSEAKRTQETANFLDFPKGWKRYNLSELYECSLSDGLSLLSERLSNVHSQVALVGHNPFVSNLCSYLSGDFTSLKTANIGRLKIPEKNFDVALACKGIWELKIL